MSTEESVRQFLSDDFSPDEKAYYCLSAGQSMERCGDYNAALACYGQAFALTPEKNDVWYFLHNNLGFCLNQFERYQEAEAYCLEAIDIDPSRHNAYKNLGVSLQGQGDYIAAARLYLRAAEIRPADPRALQHLYALLREHPEVGAAVSDIPRELGAHSDDPRMHLTLEQKKALFLLDGCNRSIADTPTHRGGIRCLCITRQTNA
jgi:tetratricopeptide (TPR) repeat protein